MEKLKIKGEELSKDVEHIIQNYLGRRTFERNSRKTSKMGIKSVDFNPCSN